MGSGMNLKDLIAFPVREMEAKDLSPSELIDWIEGERERREKSEQYEQALVSELFNKTKHLKKADVIRFVSGDRLVTIPVGHGIPGIRQVTIKKENVVS